MIIIIPNIFFLVTEAKKKKNKRKTKQKGHQSLKKKAPDASARMRGSSSVGGES